MFLVSKQSLLVVSAPVKFRVWPIFGDSAWLLVYHVLTELHFSQGEGFFLWKDGSIKMEVNPALALPNGLGLVGCGKDR